MKYIIPVIFFCLLISFSCKKSPVYTKENLTFSSDTIIFDTVFTTVGSATKRLKFYNDNALPIIVDEIELMGGENSPFNINVDGVSGTFHSNLELAGRDSLYLFAEVTLSVNDQNLPLVVEDSIRFKANGKDQYVKLVVWGQDAYFHTNEIVSGNWANDKPHVIYGIAAVGFPETESSAEIKDLTLTIPAGTKVYCHKRSFLYVYKSTLLVQGTYENEVEFRHDRLESFYDDNAGQWGGIILSQANHADIDYAIIRNAEIGLRVDTTASFNTLNLTNTVIQNSLFYNLFTAAGPFINVENCVFGDAGLISTYLFAGGEASFKHCNFVNYWSGSRSGPALALKNWWEFEDLIYVRNVTNTTFENCVAYGNAMTEFVVDTIAEAPAIFDASFTNCLFKREEPYDYPNFIGMIWNDNPLFMDTGMKDFHIGTDSPLNDAGIATSGIVLDIEGNARNITSPDIGAYEN